MTERHVATLLVALSLVAAAVLGSNALQVAPWMLGDIAYHRGVAYSVLAGDLQGEAFYEGLLSYYGGLYPLVFGLLASWTGRTVDEVISVVSWVVPLLWPLALVWLGRRLWPSTPLAVGLFVLLGTVAAPYTHRILLWVDGTLASSQNVFPVYPRDVAMLLLVVAAGAWLSPDRRVRVVVAGLCLAAQAMTHVQVGLLTAWTLAVWTALLAWRDRSWGRVAELVVAGLLAAAAAAWWWVPRLALAIETGGLLLGGYPGAQPLRLGIGNVFTAFGIVAVLALLALALLAARRSLPGHNVLAVAWIVAYLPLVAIDRLVDGSDLLSERRIWLILSIPLMVLAASAATVIARSMSPRVGIVVVVLAIVATSVPGTIATAARVRGEWDPGIAGARRFDLDGYTAATRELTARVAAEGGHVVDTYDAWAAWTWSFSGAQVPSLWLPGPFKVGFEPARATGRGYLERVREHEAAFDAGLPGICAHAARYGAGSILLEAQDGLLGTRDRTPASAFRVETRQRSERTLRLPAGDGITYGDQGGYDLLILEPGARWVVPWDAPDARLLAVEIAQPFPTPGVPQVPADAPLLAVVDGERRTEIGAGLPSGPASRYLVPLPDGVTGDLVLEALTPVHLMRVTAFEPVAGPAPADGPHLARTAELCGG